MVVERLLLHHNLLIADTEIYSMALKDKDTKLMLSTLNLACSLGKLGFVDQSSRERGRSCRIETDS